GKLVRKTGQVLERPRRVLDPWRHLEQDVAELAAVRDRLQTLPEGLERPPGRLPREQAVLELPARVRSSRGRQHGLDRFGKARRMQVMTGKEAVGLDAEQETVGRPLDPPHSVLG